MNHVPPRKAARAQFIADMLSWRPFNPEQDYLRICQAWRTATHADWVWLWLMDSDTESSPVLHLAAAYPNEDLLLPSSLRVKDNNSVAAYCLEAKTPVRVTALAQWSATVGQKSYHVQFLSELLTLGCESVVLSPLVELDSSVEHRPSAKLQSIEHPAFQEESAFKGVICLHYRTGQPVTDLTDTDLRYMGAFTARTLVHSYLTYERYILFELEQLEHKYLTSASTHAKTSRDNYLSELIEAVCRHIRVKAVSVFYQDIIRKDVECIASTGVALMNPDGSLSTIDKKSLRILRYSMNEGRTGTCYSTGQARLLPDGIGGQGPCKSIELINGEAERHLPAIIYPIPRSASDVVSEGQPCSLGVIRCKYHFSNMFRERATFFDPVEVQTLGFIARQVAPVLETMSANITRQTIISVTKHDLDTPIRMIWDKVENLRIESDDEEKKILRVNTYDILDIGMCGLIAKNLVRQLDAEPGEIRDYAPSRTNVETDIIAPIKNMLIHFAREHRNMSIRFTGFSGHGGVSGVRYRGFPDLYVDRALVSRAVVNLLVNAIKYGKRGSEIVVQANESGGSYWIDVCNQGIGVRPEEAGMLFVPGYRSPRAEKMSTGTGLGLAISRKLMERHGGNVVLVEGANPTVFRIVFPDSLRYQTRR